MKIDLLAIEAAIKPFIEAKVYNPNRNVDLSTRRTINIKGTDLTTLTKLHKDICQFLKEHKEYEKADRIKKSIEAIVNPTRSKRHI